jgi:DNA-binding transcriptional LysR family regulator
MNWDLCRSFLAVLDEGSLSSAARALGLTQPTLARHLEQLEQALDAALFVRSPRGLTPTDAALALAPHARAMASAAAAMQRTASADAEAIEGAVRIAASEVIGAEVLPGLLSDLKFKHRGLAFEIVTSNLSVDLLRRDADIAIRMTTPKQEALIAKRVGDVKLGVFAHRDYLARYGEPKALSDADGHVLIGFDNETIGVQAVRAFGIDLQRHQFGYRTDNDIAQLNAIRAGCGVGICQIGLGKRDPNLVRLFADQIEIPLETWITMHEDLRRSPRMRAVFDHLVAAMNAYTRTG